MPRKPDEYYWRGPGGDGWSHRERSTAEQTGSSHEVGTQGLSEAESEGASFAGRGPRSYQRPDDRIEEDINERLTQHPDLDATGIEVRVENGLVTLVGSVDSRIDKWLAEDLAGAVFGVREVDNQLGVQQQLAG